MHDINLQESFTRDEVLMLLELLRPRRQTLTVIPYKAAAPHIVYLQHNPKCKAWLFPGGGQEGTESHGAGVLRELAQENPVLATHIDVDELNLFTVCSVVRIAPGVDLGYRKPLTSFLSLDGLPADIVEFLGKIKTPLHLGTDIVMYIPVNGEPDLSKGVSDESTELKAFDLTQATPEFGFHHGELAKDWLDFCRTSRRPTPNRVYEFC